MSEDEARRPPVRVDQMTFDRLIRIADRLGQVQAGSPAADQAIHQALNRSGPVLAYTTVEDAAQSLLPAGFELLPATYAGGAVYAACRRIGTDRELPHPHHGQWGTTLPLAICGACLRAHAALDQDRGSAGRR
jgi:hypothetical protein